jgi:hypothetical protein
MMSDDQLITLMAFLGGLQLGKDMHQPEVAAEMHDRALRFHAGCLKRSTEVVLDGLEVKEGVKP